MAKKKKARARPAPAAKKKAAKKATSKKATKKKSARKALPDDWLTQTQAAALCRVTDGMFRRYELEPVGRVGRFAYYTRDQVLDQIERRAHRRGYQDGLRDGKEGVPEDLAELVLAKEQAELRWTQERAEGQRLKNAVLRRENAPVQMVTWAINRAGRQISATLSTLKGRLKRAQPALTHDALHEIDQVTAECQNAAAAMRLDWDEYQPDGNAESD